MLVLSLVTAIHLYCDATPKYCIWKTDKHERCTLQTYRFDIEKTSFDKVDNRFETVQLMNSALIAFEFKFKGNEERIVIHRDFGQFIEKKIVLYAANVVNNQISNSKYTDDERFRVKHPSQDPQLIALEVVSNVGWIKWKANPTTGMMLFCTVGNGNKAKSFDRLETTL